jgi:two-component system C4-dicarboxylate transport sensor histidine kinase DctB
MLRLIRIVLVLLLGVGLLMVAGYLAREQAIREVRERAKVSAQMNAALVRNNLERYRPLPFVLAQDVDVREALANRTSKALANLNHKLETMAAGIRASAIYVLDPQGDVIAANNWREAGSFVRANYRFRPYYLDAMAVGHSEDFAVGTDSQLPGLYVSHRIDRPKADIPGSTALDIRGASGALKNVGGAQGLARTPPTDKSTMGVVVVKVEFQRLEADWRRQPEPVFVTDANGVVLLSSQPEWRFHALTPLSNEAKQTMRSTLQFGDAEFIPLALLGEMGARVHLPIGSESNERYLHVQTPVQTAAGWNLHVLAPVDHTIRRAVYTAQISTVPAELLIVGAWTVWRQRHRRRIRRELERAQMLNYLETQVAERTRELAFSNVQLAHEIEERERTEHRAHCLQDELAQASKLSVLGQITAGVAHEINQPVAAIRSYAENAALLLARNRPDEAQSNMQTITSLTERIGRITSELRQFARRRVDDDRDQRADVAAAVDSALLLLGARQRHERIAVHINIECPLTAAIDPLRLEQILINVLQNAMDALSNVDQPAIWLSARIQAPKTAMLEIVVRDNGPGVDAARRMALFTPFATGKPDGLGLGLVISRELAREAQGDLDAPPSDIGGAVFVLTLPIA